MGHACIAAFNLCTYGRFVFVLGFHVNQHKVHLHAIGDVDSKIYSVCRTGREIETNKYCTHKYFLFLIIIDATKLHIFFVSTTILMKIICKKVKLRVKNEVKSELWWYPKG